MAEKNKVISAIWPKLILMTFFFALHFGSDTTMSEKIRYGRNISAIRPHINFEKKQVGDVEYQSSRLTVSKWYNNEIWL